MRHRQKLLAALIAGSVAPIAMSASDPPVPPQFTHLPILIKLNDNAIDRGHFVFGGEAAIPAPIAPNLGAAPYNPATFVPAAPSGSQDTNLSGSSEYEGETGAASNGSTIVGASNHIFPGACSASALPGSTGDCAPKAYEFNNSTPNSPTITALSRVWKGTTFGIGFDPAVDYDKVGNYYVSYGVAPLSGNYPNAIVVMKNANGGWTQLNPVTFNTNKNFDDKYYLAVDRSNSAFANRIYVAWDRNSGNNQTLYVASSSDGGTSWSAPVKVNDGKTKFERVIGAYPAVDHRNGNVYVSWHDYAKDVIYVDKSTTGGASWGTDVAAATTHTGFGMDIGCVGGRSQSPAHHLRVGPSGTLYLVYADQVSGRGFDVLFTKSIDGKTWSAPVTLNDDSGGAHQFHPTLAVSGGGTGGADIVKVSFYDRRDDVNNCLSHVYATTSSDGGATWTTNQKLTTAPSNFDGNPNGPGDYSSAAMYGTTKSWPFYSGHPSGQPFDVYTSSY